VHPDVTVVALANKLARMAWAVLWRGEFASGAGTIDQPHPSALIEHNVCGWWKRDGLAAERRPGNLVLKNGVRRRKVYEDQDARISILA
jgi:hypothetical protein